jgi:hypothetical protein
MLHENRAAAPLLKEDTRESRNCESRDHAMRLTLHTLLAYLDDVLSPPEAEELRDRIDKSEFATTLVQRIRHTVKRLRLSAPKLDGHGLGADPNTVAEYLDSAMPAEQVVDFEKVCLESDVHLAEVAACHQILAKVLHGSPAQVSDELRHRIYALPTQRRIDPAHADAPVAAGSPEGNGEVAMAVAAPVAVGREGVPTPPPIPSDRPRPEVPEYLRPEPAGTGMGRYIAILGGLAALAAVILLFLPPLSQFNPLVRSPLQVAANPEGDPAAPSPQPAIVAPDDDSDFADENPAQQPEPGPAAVGENVLRAPENLDAADNGTDEMPPAVEPGDAVADATEVRPEPMIPSDDVDPPPMPMPPGDNQDSAVASADTVIEPPTGLELGRYISDETLLCFYHEKSRNWMRVEPRSLIVEGERVLTLPVYRPQIALTSGVQLTMVGETTMQFGRSASGVTRLNVADGRLLLHAVGRPMVKTDLNLKGIVGSITLETPDSEAAVEVTSFLPPGGDPIAGDHVAVAHIFCVNGVITWQEEGVEPIQLRQNDVKSLVGDDTSRVSGPIRLPAWIDPRNTSTLDRDAAKIVDPLLPPSRPLVLSLQELANHRRIDVRVHVARSLAYVDQYSVIVKQLSEEEYKSYWMRPDGHVDTLRRQMARGGEVAQRLGEQLVEQRGERDGRILFKLLQGYTEEQLAGRGAEELVTALTHPSMDVRVLAIDSLSRITGSMHLYNPALTPEKNRSRILKWQDMAKGGAIAYSSETRPNPLVDFEPLEGERPAR